MEKSGTKFVVTIFSIKFTIKVAATALITNAKYSFLIYL